MSQVKRYKKGHFNVVGIAIGIPMGVPLGLVLGNIAIGPAIGLPIGLIIGMIMEKQLNPNPIEHTADELRKQKILSWFGIGIGLILMVILIELYFLT